MAQDTHSEREQKVLKLIKKYDSFSGTLSGFFDSWAEKGGWCDEDSSHQEQVDDLTWQLDDYIHRLMSNELPKAVVIGSLYSLKRVLCNGQLTEEELASIL